MKVLVNYLYSLAYQVLVLILPIVLTPYASRVLGVEGIGNYAVTQAFAQYFVLFGMLGIANYGKRQIAYVRNDEGEMCHTFWEINILRWVTMGVSCALYFLTIFCFFPQEARLLYSVQGVLLLASLVDISWLYAGLEAFKKTAGRSIVVKIAGVILVFIFVKDQDDVWLYALILAATTLVGQIYMWRGLPRGLWRISYDSSKLKFHFLHTIKLWIPSIAIQVYSSLDKVMLGYLVDYTQAGLYENSQKIVRMASTITTSLSSVLLPRMANYFRNGNMDLLSEMAVQAFRYISFLAFPVCFGIIGIRRTLIPWFYGVGFEAISDLLLISAWLVIVLGWSSVFGTQILVSTGREKEFTIAVSCGAVANIILNVFLIIPLGAKGALIASVVAECIGMLIMMFCVRGFMNLKTAFRSIPRYIVVGGFMAIVIYCIGEKMEYSIVNTAIQVVAGGLIYFLLLLCMRDDCIIKLLAKVRSLTSPKK